MWERSLAEGRVREEGMEGRVEDSMGVDWRPSQISSHISDLKFR